MSNSFDEEQRRATRSQRSRQPASRSKPSTYEITTQFPEKPDVTLVFEGLMWFRFHGKDECEVGIHNSTRGTAFPHHHPHQLSLRVWDIADCKATDNCTFKDYPIDPETFDGIRIDVNRPVDAGVFVFQKDKNAFDRFNPNNHENDWRWVLDFEREPLYPEGVELDLRKINPAVSINYGVFYTLHKTKSEFSLISEFDGEEHPMGMVPQLVGGNLRLNDGGDVDILIRRKFPFESTPIKLNKRANACYQVDIKNVCVKNGEICMFDPDSDFPQKRNDFYLYYDTCAVPDFADEYTLKRTKVYTAEKPKNICLPKQQEGKEHWRSSNEAPCGPVGAGGGGGG